MLSIYGRIELNNWYGFKVCGGGEHPWNDPYSNAPGLRISTDTNVHEFAKVERCDVDDEEDIREEEFEKILPSVIHGDNPDCRIVDFMVFPDKIELSCTSKEYGYKSVEIDHRVSHLDIIVPVTDDENGPTERFHIDFQQDRDEKYCSANIYRSGDKCVCYRVHYEDAFVLRPGDATAEAIAKALSPDSCDNDSSGLGPYYDRFKKMYLEINYAGPILPTTR